MEKIFCGTFILAANPSYTRFAAKKNNINVYEFHHRGEAKIQAFRCDETGYKIYERRTFTLSRVINHGFT
jgi:hypothetical protein